MSKQDLCCLWRQLGRLNHLERERMQIEDMWAEVWPTKRTGPLLWQVV